MTSSSQLSSADTPPLAPPAVDAAKSPKSFGWLMVLLIVAAAVLVTAGATYWVLRSTLFKTEFTPVSLTAPEAHALDLKLDRLEAAGMVPEAVGAKVPVSGTGSPGEVEPLPYTEDGSARRITFTERELNALIARDSDLAHRLAIDLEKDLVSARFIVPLDPDLPLMGGQTLRIRTGIGFSYNDGKPSMILRGVSVMGVPLPKAWLGGLKGMDLLAETGPGSEFWQGVADGIENLEVTKGHLLIQLKP